MITLTLDGSSIRNGYPSASAGFSAVISLQGRVLLEVQRALCPTCDSGLQTSNRAELRAATWALSFLVEVAKRGYASQLCGASTARDGRIVDASDVRATLRTDSAYVYRGLLGRITLYEHQDLWESVKTAKRCMEENGMELRVEHVKAHNGDRLNERADVLAKRAARGGEEEDAFWCRACEVSFEGENKFAVMGNHFKERHLGRDMKLETEMFSNDRFVCSDCDRVTKTENALMQHLRDKHGYAEM